MTNIDPRRIDVRLRYEMERQDDRQPDLRALASLHTDLESELFKQLLILHFWRQWESGQGEPVTVYLKPYRDRKDATQDPETRRQLVIAQILQMGSEPEEKDYLDKFEDLRAELLRIFEVYRAHGRPGLRQIFDKAVTEFWGEGPETPTVFFLANTSARSPQEDWLPRTSQLQVQDEYLLQQEIGRGSFKLVYRAIQRSTGRAVAVKYYSPKNTEIMDHTEYIEHKHRFLREGRIQALMDHPHIPVILTLSDTNLPVIVEKLLPQRTWSQVLSERSVDQNLRTLLRVSRALAYAHLFHKIIHRDIKPINVVIGDQEEEVYLVDWGFALHVDGDSPCVGHPALHWSEENSRCGTPSYMAPEMALGQSNRLTFATDVFILGGILLEILTGNPPHRGGIANAIHHASSGHPQFSMNSLEMQGHPPELIRIVVRALETEIAHRYKNADAFASAIQTYLDHILLLERCRQAEEGLNQLNKDMTLAQNSGKSLNSLRTFIPRLLYVADQFLQIRQAWYVGGGDNETPDRDDGYIKASEGEAALRLTVHALSKPVDIDDDEILTRDQLKLLADIDGYAATARGLELLLDQDSPPSTGPTNEDLPPIDLSDRDLPSPTEPPLPEDGG